MCMTVRESQDSFGAPLEKPRAQCATMRIRHARVGSRVKGLMSTVGVRLRESKSECLVSWVYYVSGRAEKNPWKYINLLFRNNENTCLGLQKSNDSP